MTSVWMREESFPITTPFVVYLGRARVRVEDMDVLDRTSLTTERVATGSMTTFENALWKLTWSKKALHVAGIYHPPGGSVKLFIDELLITSLNH